MFVYLAQDLLLIKCCFSPTSYIAVYLYQKTTTTSYIDEYLPTELLKSLKFLVRKRGDVVDWVLVVFKYLQVQMINIHVVASLVVMMESLIVTMFTVVVSWTIRWAEHAKGCLQYDDCLQYDISHLLAVLQTLAVTFHHCLQLSQQNLTTIAVKRAKTMTLMITITMAVKVTTNW